MTTEYFSITSQCGYPIPCKLFSKSNICQSVIIGIHGFGGDKESSALTLLAEKMPQDYKLIAFDLPAHGCGADDCFLSLKNCISDLITVCDYAMRLFSSAKIYVFATSFGGYIWLNAEKELEQRISRAVLRVPAVGMAETLSKKLLPCSLDEFIKQGFAVCGFERRFRVTYDFYRELLGNDIAVLSPAVPTLMICGDKDELVDYGAQLSFAERNTYSVRLITLKNAGHRFKGDGELETAIAAAIDFFGADE